MDAQQHRDAALEPTPHPTVDAVSSTPHPAPPEDLCSICFRDTSFPADSKAGNPSRAMPWHGGFISPPHSLCAQCRAGWEQPREVRGSASH